MPLFSDVPWEFIENEQLQDLCAQAAKINGPGIREVARIFAEGFSRLIH
jgi:hypothetical protein